MSRKTPHTWDGLRHPSHPAPDGRRWSWSVTCATPEPIQGATARPWFKAGTLEVPGSAPTRHLRRGNSPGSHPSKPLEERLRHGPAASARARVARLRPTARRLHRCSPGGHDAPTSPPEPPHPSARPPRSTESPIPLSRHCLPSANLPVSRRATTDPLEAVPGDRRHPAKNRRHGTPPQRGFIAAPRTRGALNRTRGNRPNGPRVRERFGANTHLPTSIIVPRAIDFKATAGCSASHPLGSTTNRLRRPGSCAATAPRTPVGPRCSTPAVQLSAVSRRWPIAPTSGHVGTAGITFAP